MYAYTECKFRGKNESEYVEFSGPILFSEEPHSALMLQTFIQHLNKNNYWHENKAHFWKTSY